MVKLTKKEKKQVYFQKLEKLMATYPNILVVNGDNVGSKQFAEVRFALRGKAVILFGKNTMMRTCLRNQLDEHPEYQALIDAIKLNVGLVFCIADPAEVRELVVSNKVPAAARQGALAPVDVKIPAGPCGLDPSQTSFFQALGIATKIVKGQIDIVADVHLIKKDSRVAASQAALLQKLGIKPFEYGLVCTHIYQAGEIYPSAVLDITDEVIQEKFLKGISNVAAMSLALNFPTSVSMPHLILRAYKNCVALVADSEYTFPQMNKIREYLKNPAAFAVAAAPVAGAVAAPGAAPAAAAAKEEEEEAMDFDLFD